MLNQLENLEKCVGGNNELIDQWLQARKGLLVAYYHLIGLKPNKESILPWTKKRWSTMCKPHRPSLPPIAPILPGRPESTPVAVVAGADVSV